MALRRYRHRRLNRWLTVDFWGCLLRLRLHRLHCLRLLCLRLLCRRRLRRSGRRWLPHWLRTWLGVPPGLRVPPGLWVRRGCPRRRASPRRQLLRVGVLLFTNMSDYVGLNRSKIGLKSD